MTDRLTREERDELARRAAEDLPCSRCSGTGELSTPCPYCHDSTWDHECPTDAECDVCHGTGSLRQRWQDDMTRLLADLDAMERERDEARARADSAIAALWEVEWGDSAPCNNCGLTWRCPVCGRCGSCRHTADCPLAAALAAEDKGGVR